MSNPDWSTALVRILSELVDGPGEPGPWVLDGKAAGLIGLLRGTPADVASREPGPGRKSIAAHVGHLRYALDLLNRWASGEPNPFATADWPGSWAFGTVTQEEWSELVTDVETAAHDWISAVAEPREWDEIALTGTLSSAPHVAYHLGAIRQLAMVAH